MNIKGTFSLWKEGDKVALVQQRFRSQTTAAHCTTPIAINASCGMIGYYLPGLGGLVYMNNEHDGEVYRVLVADDEPIVHNMMRKIIDGSNLPLVLSGTASSAEEALGIVQSVQPHICLLDIQMGEMSGLELAARINEILDYKPATIYITAHTKFEYAQQAVRLGAMDYLVKPIRRALVLEALRRAVNHVQAVKLEQLEKEQLKKQLHSLLPATVSTAGPAEEARRVSIAQAVRQYIDEHHAEPVTVSTVSDQLNLSPGYLGSLFKTVYGVSIKAYLRRVRIARAKDLMLDQTLNLSEISQQVGFDDISYFSQCFLEETGVRPSEYRGGGKKWPK